MAEWDAEVDELYGLDPGEFVAARNLARRFHDNFAKFEGDVTEEVRNAGPRAD